MQVAVFQLAGVNVGVLFHVLAVVDGLVKGAEVVTGQITLIFAERTMSHSIRTMVIHPDNDAAIFAEGRLSVFVIADDVRSAIALGNSTFYIAAAGGIDGGVAGGSIDGHCDVLRSAGAAAADSRGQHFLSIIGYGVFAADGGHSATGNVDRCFSVLMPIAGSDCGTAIRANSRHVGVLGDGDVGIQIR